MVQLQNKIGIKWWCAVWLPVLAGLAIAAVPPSQTPKTQGGTTQTFFYTAPHQLQKKIVIKSLEDQVLPTGGNVLLKGLTVDTYTENNQPELTMEAPECVFNRSEMAGHSPGPLKLRTSDGNSFIEGTGYLWTYLGSNLTVTISNRVSTTLKRDFLNKGTNTPARPASATNQFIYIHADRVFLDYSDSLVTYTGHVHAEDDQLDITCEVLKIRGATDNAASDTIAGGKISEIVADQHVVITGKTTAGSATGDRAVYSVVDGAEVVTLTGDPHWEAAPRAATAQAFVYDITANTLRAVGEARFTLPSDAINKSGFVMLPQPTGATNASNTNVSLMDITAGAIMLELPATNGAPLRGIIAETNVLMLDLTNDSRVSANRAVYTQTNGMMELTGQASWQMHQRIARGELLTYNQKDNTFSARTNAYLQFPPNELKQSPAFGTALATNTSLTTNQLVKVSADSYEYLNETLTFSNHVQGAFLEDEVVRDTLESDVLALSFLNTNVLKDVTAEGRVHLRQLPRQDAQGKTGEGDFKSDRLQIQMQTNGLPELVTATGSVTATRTEISTNRTVNALLQTNHTTFAADKVTASFLPNTNKVNGVTSEGKVVMTRDDYTARGAKVVYTATNDVAVLTGDPKLETTGGWLTSDEMITYDHANGIIQATRHTHAVYNLPSGALDKIKGSAMMPTKSK